MSIATDKRSFEDFVLYKYFLSGWGFLIPYLLVYLLYYWLKWPVNPFLSSPPLSAFHPPALIYVYWILHGFNLLLVAIAFRAHFRNDLNSNSGAPQRGSDLLSWLPWMLLALFFFIPGPYLEFPSDPWAHFARINEWSGLTNIGEHSVWKKSSYFIIYSLIGNVSNANKIFYLDAYYTIISIILCWQYFRLARSVGLSESGAMLFVLLQSLLFGNSIFSFYRYYGISSTIYSQIGAVALVRIWLEATAVKKGGGYGSTAKKSIPFPSVFALLLSSAALLLLIAFNHIQGLAIAGLGLAAVAIWRLTVWKPIILLFVVAAFIALSFYAILYWPRHPAIDQLYRPNGWLSAWYGFNVFPPSSPASERALQILGISGVVNLGAGLLLLRRNHIVGWITILPVIALCLPFIAIPFSNALARGGDLSNIIVFHRVLLAIPNGLAIICLGEKLPRFFTRRSGSFSQYLLIPLLVLLFTISTFPPGKPFFNRGWHAMMKVPEDLAVSGGQSDFINQAKTSHLKINSLIAATSGLSYVLAAKRPLSVICTGRTYYTDRAIPSVDLESIKNKLIQYNSIYRLVTVVSAPKNIYTPYSIAAIFSEHWLPQEVALAFSGAKELRSLSLNRGLIEITPVDQVDFFKWDNSVTLLHSIAASKMPGYKAFPLGSEGYQAIVEPRALVGEALYTLRLPLSTGHFSCKTQYLRGPNPYATLLAIDSKNTERDIYIYILCKPNESNGSIYYNFGGHLIGPSSVVIPNNTRSRIDFNWEAKHQELLLDGQIVLESKLPVLAGTAYRVCIGWHGEDASEIWYGCLQSIELCIGTSSRIIIDY